jgi:hypothetical protein
MKKKKFLLIGLAMLFATLFTSCTLSTEQLAEAVKDLIAETWQEQGITAKIDKVVLVHESDNNYSGTVTVKEDGETYKLSVKVTYDGENIEWDMTESLESLIKDAIEETFDDIDIDDDIEEAIEEAIEETLDDIE